MPRIPWETPIDHSSDAGYRLWVQELLSNFISSGLVQTSDSGQMNPSTATRPSANSFTGYLMLRMKDALQASRPVFLRLEPGTANVTNTPALRLTIGTGTNGSGTLTGLVSSARVMHNGTTLVANASTANFKSYATHSAGFVGLAWKLSAGSGPVAIAGFTIQRSTSNVGIPTADAVMLITSGATSSETVASEVSLLNFKTGEVFNAIDGHDISLIVMRRSSSLSGLKRQLYVTWMSIPEVIPNLCTAAYIKAEIPDGTEIDIALVGSTPRHYIAVGNALRSCAYNGPSSTTARGAVMLWEN
jgi:hypothetical protein